MQNYLAFFHLGKSGKIDVTFPQFPGCVSQGDDFGDAQRMAAEALALHVEGMQEDGEGIPPTMEDIGPSAFSKFLSSARKREDDSVIPFPVPLLPPFGKIVRIQVTIDDRLLKQIDAVSKNRSAFLAEAAAARLGMA